MGKEENVSKRVLNPRRCLRGPEQALEGTFGKTLVDGAECYVLDKQTNYRFVQRCELHADGEFVVMPADKTGRWIREQGLVGFAALRGGAPGPELVFVGYAEEQLVQFASSPDGSVVYTGAVPRAATVVAQAEIADRALVLVVAPAKGKQYVVDGTPQGATHLTVLHPGDKVSLHSAAVPSAEMRAGLFVSLS